MEPGWIWVTSVETSEPIGVPVARISMIERKEPQTGHVVAIFLDTGKEGRIVESLEDVRTKLASATITD